MSDSFGNIFRITLYGGSHTPVLGVRMEGVPEGILLSATDFVEDILRRKSGAEGTTPRIESDIPSIVSGIDSKGLTTGGTLDISFRNENIRPEDYSRFEDVPRPGHADYVAKAKYGALESGSGKFSGRMTLPLVAAGVVAKKISGFCPKASIVELGGSKDPEAWDGLVSDALRDGDSLGAVVECRTEGLPVGLGEPFFDGVEQLLSHIIFSIPGVRGIEFGDGFASSAMRGSAHNDAFGPEGIITKNGAGGVNGGLTNGAPLVFRVAFKPTSTIKKSQETWDFSKSEIVSLVCSGRHDCCFALRTPVVVEAVTAIVLTDLYLSIN